jgi:hypothetical protein
VAGRVNEGISHAAWSSSDEIRGSRTPPPAYDTKPVIAFSAT